MATHKNEAKSHQVSNNLYNRLLLYIENIIDKKIIKSTNYKKGRDFEAIAKELKI